MLRLDVIQPELAGSSLAITGDSLLLGRAELGGVMPDVIVGHPSVSRHHARLTREGDRYLVEDLGSTNKTWVNGNHLPPGRREVLNQHSYLQIGEVQFLVNYAEAGRFAPPPQVEEQDRSPVRPTGRFRAEATITVGRSPDCDVVLSSPQVALRHATVEFVGGIGFVRDLGTSSGTFLNGEPVERPTPLKPGDTVMVGMTKLHFDGHALVRFDEQGAVRIDALRLSMSVSGPAGPVRILQDVSLQICPRELVAIVGQSGAGKTTLLNALSGYTACSGSVLYNGWDLRKSRRAFAGAIGYVPQEEIIHADLTVQEALSYAADLRLSRDLPAADRHARVMAVLEMVALTDRRDVVIRKLSGGQRKRVNVAVELLSDPSVLFLDEPATGLDPHMEAQMMATLRGAADAGRTVVMVTHATQSLDLVDLIVFMGYGGHVCFIGRPDEALEFFGCQTLAAAYGCIGQTAEDAEAAAARYAASEYAERYVWSRQRAVDGGAGWPGGAGELGGDGASAPALAPARADFARQFLTLAARYATVTFRDARYLALLLLQAPLLAVVIAAAMKFDRFVLSPELKSAGELRTVGPLDLMMPKFLTLLLVVAILWMGVSSAAREIVKERSILRRERMVSLGLPVYIASKFAVLAAFVLAQTALMVAVVSLFVKLDGPGFQGYGQLCGILFLTGLAGAGLGLIVSSLCLTPDQAAGLVPLLVLPQIALCGAIVPMDDPGLKQASAAIVANWGYRAAAQALGLPEVYDRLARAGPASRGAAASIAAVRADIEKKSRTPLPSSLLALSALAAVGVVGAGAALRLNLSGP